jgi:four helix bundle protein
MGITITSFRDLIVWQKSMSLVINIYSQTKTFPDSEKFGLVSQMRRAAVSIPSNIAEGKQRGTRKDYRQFLVIAYGSSAELETQTEIAHNLEYLDLQTYQELISNIKEIGRMLNGLINKLSPET